MRAHQQWLAVEERIVASLFTFMRFFFPFFSSFFRRHSSLQLHSKARSVLVRLSRESERQLVIQKVFSLFPSFESKKSVHQFLSQNASLSTTFRMEFEIRLLSSLTPFSPSNHCCCCSMHTEHVHSCKIASSPSLSLPHSSPVSVSLSAFSLSCDCL